MTFFEWAYKTQPPWDTGRPQPAFARLAEAGEITGSVLDAGCGTGENALYLAARGHEVWGIDIVPAAIERARSKARRRGLAVTFRVADALKLGRLGRSFDTVIDCGLFHVFSDEERPRFVRSLAQVLRPGGTYHMMCFSELEPGDSGPRRVTRAEIRKAFGAGWWVREIRKERFESRVNPAGSMAWLATIVRLDDATRKSKGQRLRN